MHEFKSKNTDTISHGSTRVQHWMKLRCRHIEKRQDKEEDGAKLSWLDNLVEINGFIKDWKRISPVSILGWDYQLCAIEFKYHTFVLHIYIYNTCFHVNGETMSWEYYRFCGTPALAHTPFKVWILPPKFANPKRPTTRRTCMVLMHGLTHYCKPLAWKERSIESCGGMDCFCEYYKKQRG